ncbi:MAG: GLPGLI family protein [Bacteroidales bacterium]|nr:GLPGLI family protein [Bacteroidales bacterium]
MKRLLAPIVFLLGLTAFAQGGYEAVYQQTLALPDEVKNIEDEAVRRTLTEQYEAIKNPYTLLCYDGKTLFSPVNITKAVLGTRSIIYVDPSSGEKITKEDVMGKAYLVKEDYVPEKWTVLDETAEIGGYHCKKAVRGFDGEFTAWFTEEIPVQAGPMGYGSLPGLIVKLEMESMTFTLSSVKSSEKLSLKAPSGGKKVSRDELDEIIVEKARSMSNGTGGRVKVVDL